MRPLAALDLFLNDRGWYADPSPSTLYRQARTFDATAYLLAEIIHTVQEETHYIAPFTGDTGEGKSISAQRIASKSRFLKWKLKGKTIQTWYTWSPIQTAAKAWKGAFRQWDDIIQDEHRNRNVGKGASTASAMLEGLEQTSFRFDKNNILYCSPVDHAHRYHFALEAEGWERELSLKGRTLHNVNILTIFGPRFHMPMGTVYLSDEDWPIDPYIAEQHETGEAEWKGLVKRYGGIPPEVDPDIVDYCQARLLDQLKQKYPDDMLDMNRLELERVWTVELQLPTLFFMDQALAGVQAEIQKLARQRKAEAIAEQEVRAAEHRQEQETLIDVLAPRVVKYFLEFSDDKLAFPNASAMVDYLRRFADLDPAYHKKCVDRVRHLWVKMKAGSEGVDGLKETVITPPAISPSEFSFDDAHWFQIVRERMPSLVLDKYWEAYSRYLDQEKNWKSHRQIADQLGLGKSAITEQFQKIEGAIKRTIGHEFERVLARLYHECPSVLRLDPSVDEVAKDRQPDRIVYLDDGSIRVCSWKAHNENENIKVKNSPEVKLARALIQEGKRVQLVLEGLWRGHFFSITVDPDQESGSVRVRKRDLLEWPPQLQELFTSQGDQPAGNRLEYSAMIDGGHGEGAGVDSEFPRGNVGGSESRPTGEDGGGE